MLTPASTAPNSPYKPQQQPYGTPPQHWSHPAAAPQASQRSAFSQPPAQPQAQAFPMPMEYTPPPRTHITPPPQRPGVSPAPQRPGATPPRQRARSSPPQPQPQPHAPPQAQGATGYATPPASLSRQGTFSQGHVTPPASYLSPRPPVAVVLPELKGPPLPTPLLTARKRREQAAALGSPANFAALIAEESDAALGDRFAGSGGNAGPAVTAHPSVPFPEPGSHVPHVAPPPVAGEINGIADFKARYRMMRIRELQWRYLSCKVEKAFRERQQKVGAGALALLHFLFCCM